jgi:hypothetical protein
MKPTLVVIAVTALSCLAAAAVGIPRDSLFFFAGGTLLLATLATLALERLVLARYDHLLFPADSGRRIPLHAKLRGKIQGLDRWGLFLTIGLLLYGFIYAAYLVVQIYEKVLTQVFHVVRHI